jgi:pimeloyl-ACP methyl ester carboxylesterase
LTHTTDHPAAGGPATTGAGAGITNAARPIDGPTARPHDRPTAFCLHALGASALEFEGLRERLAETLDVVAIDLPGFGDAADDTRGGVTVDDMVRQVAQRIHENGATRWLLVGHSMGGKISSVVASQTLSGANGLYGLAGVVLLAASPTSPEPMDEERRETMLGWAADGRLDEAAAREFVDANVGAPLDPADDVRMTTDVRRASREAWLAWLEQGSREDWSPDVGVLDVPALIVAGGADGDLGPEAQRALNGRTYPRARHLVLDGAGHLLPLERPDEVADAVDAFWRHEAGRAPSPSPDFSATIAGPRTSAKTRGILARRALADDPRYEPRVLTVEQLRTLRVLADVVVPQDAGIRAIDLAARVDAQLARGEGDGWRNADLPPDPEAYRLALDALADFADRTAAQQVELVTAIVAGDPDPELQHHGDSGGGSSHHGDQPDGGDDAPEPEEAHPLSVEQLTAWFEDCRVDLVRHWLSHPATMEQIGYDGFANGGDGVRMQGFRRLGADEREGWEPRMEMAR